MQDLLPGDILLCYSPSIYRDLIVGAEDFYIARREAFRQGKPAPAGRPIYSHVAIYVGGGKVIEALGRGVVISDVSKYAGKADTWRVPVASYEMRRAWVQRAYKRVGYKYAWGDILVQAVRMFFAVNIPYNFSHSVICSVLAYDCVNGKRWHIAQRRNCSPQDIAMYGMLNFAGVYGG